MPARSSAPAAYCPGSLPRGRKKNLLYKREEQEDVESRYDPEIKFFRPYSCKQETG